MATNEQLDELARLGRLREDGVLTEEEFVEQKRAILCTQGPAFIVPVTPRTSGGSQALIAGILVVGTLVVVLGLWTSQANDPASGLSSPASGEAQAAPVPASSPATCIQVLEQHWENGSGYSFISGTAINNCDAEVKYPQITFNGFDPSHALIDTVEAAIGAVAPHEKWRFQTTPIKEGATSYELKEIS